MLLVATWWEASLPTVGVPATLSVQRLPVKQNISHVNLQYKTPIFTGTERQMPFQAVPGTGIYQGTPGDD